MHVKTLFLFAMLQRDVKSDICPSVSGYCTSAPNTESSKSEL